MRYVRSFVTNECIEEIRLAANTGIEDIFVAANASRFARILHLQRSGQSAALLHLYFGSKQF